MVPLIVDVCNALTGKAPRNHVAQMLGTAAAESGFTERVQRNDGPARGLWQMEPGMTGAMDNFRNWLRFPGHAEDFEKLASAWLHLECPPLYFTPSEADLAWHLQYNDYFAGLMARIKYLRDPEQIPTSVRGHADYWLRVYNGGGKGTIEHYLDQWYACGCPELMEDVK